MCFLKKIDRTCVLFVSPLMHLFWTSGNIWPGFQSQAGSHCLCAFSPHGFLRFTSGAKPADLLVSSMVTNLFKSIYLHTYLAGLKYVIKCAASLYLCVIFSFSLPGLLVTIKQESYHEIDDVNLKGAL